MKPKTFKTLYEKSSVGKIKYWKIEVTGTKQEATITVKYGVDGEKERGSTKVIDKGKNIGRSNETTPFEQACLEAESTWKKKIDKGYVQSTKDLDTKILLPMLAHRFDKRKHNITYPCYVQRKIDGARLFAIKISDTKIKYISRLGKEYTTLEHLTPILLKILNKNEILDGEIYSPNYDFNVLMSFLKKDRPESKTLEFWVFDIADLKKSFEDRYERVQEIVKNAKIKFIKLVKSIEIKDEKEIYSYHEKFVSEGFEGCIIRNKQGLYKFKNRSKDLQKYKVFEDSEFEIIGGTPGVGTEEGAVTFICKIADGQTFRCRPRGTIELRRKQMDSIDSLIGKMLTVRYQGLSVDNIPRFPIGLGIRDYE